MKSTKKKLNRKGKVIKHSFSGSNITKYAGLNSMMKYMNRQGLVATISRHFPTEWKNATKFGNNQILLSVILASLSGISRMNKIANFTNDGLVAHLLHLSSSISKSTLSNNLKALGESGARKLSALFLCRNAKRLEKSGLREITLDVDSTVKSVCGNQQGAAKGYNGFKKGAKSYHPLLVFVSEMKLLYHSWFRTGSAYTSNGTVDILQEVKASLPATVEKVFFRADSGFFDGKILDLLESYEWDYLIKVKLKNLKKLLKGQSWTTIDHDKGIAICEFTYKAKKWKKARTFKAVRTIDKYEEVEFLGQKEFIAIYKYVCFVSSYKEKDAIALFELYKQRAVCETWIEQVKGHAKAGSTLTDDFWTNDILWQLSVAAYNISVMFRSVKTKYKKQEHQTFIDWFIRVPARIVRSGRQKELKLYEHHFFREDWEELDGLGAVA